ncbi:hypothetical protein Plec18170_007453 [Paecilomyces lecythidis]
MASFETEAFTLLAIAIIVIAVRTYARLTSAGLRNFQLDDYLMLVAAVIYGLETGAAYSVGAHFHGLANNSMTDEQRANLDPSTPEYHMRVGGSKIQVAGWSLYTTLLWVLKSCMAVFYSRLTSGLVDMTVRIRIAYVAVGATYLAVILSILFGCHPMHKNWQIYPNPGNHCQPAVSKIDIYVTVVLNVVTDAYLMTIPAPMLWTARLPLRRKLSLVVLFSGGLFVMMAGILRCVLILTAGANGAQQAGSWACRETFVAVVIGNAPMIYPLFRRILRRLGILPSESQYVYSDQPNTPGNSTGYKRRLYQHPLSVPETKWESDEQYILEDHTPNSRNPGSHSLEQRRSRLDGIKVTFETSVQSAADREDDVSLGHKTATGCPGRDLSRMDSRDLPRFVP